MDFDFAQQHDAEEFSTQLITKLSNHAVLRLLSWSFSERVLRIGNANMDVVNKTHTQV